MSRNFEQTVDQHEIKFAMVATILLIALSWILNSWIPTAIAAVCQLLSSTGSNYAPYYLIYKGVMVPAKIIKPKIIPDDPVPHRFAALFGGIFTLAAAIFLWADYLLAGWIVAFIVFVLQSLNFWVNFCLMYYMYYLLNRIGIRGFKD